MGIGYSTAATGTTVEETEVRPAKLASGQRRKRKEVKDVEKKKKKRMGLTQVLWY